MKISEVKVELVYMFDKLTINCPKGEYKELMKVADLHIDQDAEYDIEIKKRRQGRSLNANAYFWTLCAKLARKLNQNQTDIYRKLIFEVGVFDEILMKNEAVESFKRLWEKDHIGRFCIERGNWKERFTILHCYKGSSDFDTKKMAQLIDSIVAECKEQNIETLTPNELAELKASWGGGGKDEERLGGSLQRN